MPPQQKPNLQPIKGLPADAVAVPVSQAAAAPLIQGLPQGATAEPISGGLEQGLPTGLPNAPSVGQPGPPIGQFAKDLLTGPILGAANTVGSSVSGVARLLHKIPYIGQTLAPEEGIRALEARTAERSQAQNPAQQLGKSGEQIGEFLLPSGMEEHLPALAAKLPWLGRVAMPLLRTGESAAEMGIRNASQGGSFGTGALTGAGGGVLGEGMRALAPSTAESAMNVTAPMRGHGKTVGEALLNDTKGLRPETVAATARQSLNDLTSQMEAGAHAATQAGAQISTDAAHQVLDNAIAKAPRNARGYIEKLNGLRSLLDFNPAGSVGPQQRVFTPDEILEMKRGIGTEIQTWEPQLRKTVEPIKQRLYGALDNELDNAIPGNAELNQKISSLISAQKAATRVGKTAGVPQKIGNRVAAHTGALVGTLAGGLAGYKHGGAPEAAAGAAAGLILPEIAATPEFQMFMARRLAAPQLPLRAVEGAGLQLARPQQ